MNVAAGEGHQLPQTRRSRMQPLGVGERHDLVVACVEQQDGGAGAADAAVRRERVPQEPSHRQVRIDLRRHVGDARERALEDQRGLVDVGRDLRRRARPERPPVDRDTRRRHTDVVGEPAPRRHRRRHHARLARLAR